MGVVPDRIHRITKNDLLNYNQDLAAHAASILAGLPVRALAVELRPRGEGAFEVSATTANISRLDAYLDCRPVLTLDVEDGITDLDLPPTNTSGSVLELRGFDGDQLVAARRIEV